MSTTSQTRPSLLGERIGGAYLWLWLSLLASVLLYFPLYLWACGNVTIDKDRWWVFAVHKRQAQAHRQPLGIIAYPLVYSLTMFPLLVTRWYGMAHPNGAPPTVTFITSSIFGLNGLFDALLLVTRPGVLLFRNPESEGRSWSRRRGRNRRGRAPSQSTSPPRSLRESSKIEESSSPLPQITVTDYADDESA